MTDLEFCEAVRLRSSATDTRVDLLGLLMEATDRLAKASAERDEARKAARSIYKSHLTGEFFMDEIANAALANWQWLEWPSDD